MAFRRRTFLLSLVFLGLAGVSLTAQAQAVLHGRVTDDTGAPLPNANVYVHETAQGAATDEDGRYRLASLPAGTYTVAVSAIGFQTVDKRLALEKGETRTWNVSMTTDVMRQEEVVVTGTMRETHVKESPVKVDVVGSERLQKGKTSSNFMDLIGSVGGLTTQLNCGVCGTNAIRVNGVEGANTAVLVDGMPIMGPLASVYGLNGISPSIIDQVEVIKGPQSTLYGTQALGGVVNVLTKNPANTPTFSADAYAKSTREGSVTLAASPQKGRFEGFVSGTAVRMENAFDDNGDGFSDAPRQSRLSLFGKGTLSGKDGEPRASAGLKLYGENRTGGPPNFTDDLRGSDEIYGESIYTRRAELMAEAWPSGVDRRLRLSGALTYHDQDSYYGTEHYVGTQKIAFGQATWSQEVAEPLQVLTGVSTRYDVYNDNTPATTTAERRFIPGVFGQGEYTVGALTMLGGLRFDHHGEHGIVTAPRVSAKYSPTEATTMRTSAGTGFRVVNVFTEDHAALTGSREVVFEDDLAPERSRSVTASVEHIFPLGAAPLTLSIDGFYTRFSNKIIPNYDRSPNLIVYKNLDGFSVTRGFSVALNQNFTAVPLAYNTSVTVTDVYTQERGDRRSVTYAPDFTGSVGATYAFRSIGTEVEYAGRLTGPKRMPDYYVERFGRDRWSPTHTTHDLKVTTEFLDVNGPTGMGVEAYVSVENLLDYTQGSPLVDASAPFDRDDNGKPFDTIYTWGPIVGRTVSVGMRVNVR
ncbi:TonB-dependent receptor [Salinibacter altiplanensis]|uniref:TonB-dependent receptor n=1 Tax=Salinibacter altiplanensis TaxID=1803181 RepID=UPI000C9F59E5|nr:TonB-dependent receptor [Salinibacter altiplanensis]